MPDGLRVVPMARPKRGPRIGLVIAGRSPVPMHARALLQMAGELPDADVVISQAFWPAYLTAERIAKARNLKLAITAGIGSDHVDLDAAVARDITVAEVTFSNSISVAEHVVMMMLSLVRNYLPSHQWVLDVRLHYTDRHRLPESVEEELGLTFHESAADMVPHCDIVTINAPLHPETEGLFRRQADRHDETGRLPDQHRPPNDTDQRP